MSAVETKDTRGREILWMGIPPETVSIGTVEVSKRQFFTGIALFLAGEKDFSMGGTSVRIPDTVDGDVKLGEIEMPYEDFVDGIAWGMNWQRGRATHEDHYFPMHYATQGMVHLAAERLKQSVPERNDKRIEWIKGNLTVV